jgi:hypothetical protein
MGGPISLDSSSEQNCPHDERLFLVARHRHELRPRLGQRVPAGSGEGEYVLQEGVLQQRFSPTQMPNSAASRAVRVHLELSQKRSEDHQVCAAASRLRTRTPTYFTPAHVAW